MLAGTRDLTGITRTLIFPLVSSLHAPDVVKTNFDQDVTFFFFFFTLQKGKKWDNHKHCSIVRKTNP